MSWSWSPLHGDNSAYPSAPEPVGLGPPEGYGAEVATDGLNVAGSFRSGDKGDHLVVEASIPSSVRQWEVTSSTTTEWEGGTFEVAQIGVAGSNGPVELAGWYAPEGLGGSLSVEYPVGAYTVTGTVEYSETLAAGVGLDGGRGGVALTTNSASAWMAVSDSASVKASYAGGTTTVGLTFELD